MKKKLVDTIFVAILIIGNLLIIYPLFLGEFTSHVSSIESQYFSHIKFIVENFPNITWQPFWYTGFPFYLFYQPVLPFSLSLFKAVTGIPTSVVYRYSIAFFYILGGVSIYFLLRDWTKKAVPSFLGALIYSLGPSLTVLIPTISSQVTSKGLLPWRLIVLTIYGEGAHIWGLAFIPLGLIFFRRLLKKQSLENWLFSIFFSVLILLTSITAFMPFLIFVSIIWISEILQKKSKGKTTTLFIFLAFTVGISFFWYNPSFIKALLGFAESGAGGIFNGLYANPIVFLIFSVPLFAICYFIFTSILRKRPRLTTLFIGCVSFILIFATVYLRYCCRLALLPFPLDYIPRFGPEVELTFSIFLAVALSYLLDRLKARPKIFHFAMNTLLVMFAASILFFLWSKRNYAYGLTAPNNDITSTSEYVLANWLKNNTNGERVYATGTNAQWLDLWSEVPQIRGAADQAVINPLLPHIIYQVYWGEEGQLAVDWLSALGVKYIVVNTQSSTVNYKDYRFPSKFEDLAGPVFEYKGDIIYRLPTVKTGLVYLIDGNKVQSMDEIESVLDEESLDRYLLLTERDPNAVAIAFRYDKPWSDLYINGNGINRGDGLLIRISYHPGWQAIQNGKELQIRRDPIGYMILQSDESNKDIKLHFSPTWDVRIAYLISILALVFFILFVFNVYRGKED
jgi:hypothetical protein